MRTHALFFPFDLFGHPGTRNGAELLADAFQEMLRENRREKVSTRARAYAGKVRFEEFLLDNPTDLANWRCDARETIDHVLDENEFLLWTTGNHLGVLPVYESISSKHDRWLVVQFDAHLDIYNLSDCTRELSHGNFLLHADAPLPRIVNIGHREQLLRTEHIRQYFHETISAEAIHHDTDAAIVTLLGMLNWADKVFIDIDCDVFDEAFFPAVVQPEPFGLSPSQVLSFLGAIWSEKVRGISISEFFPAHDHRDRSLATLMWLMEWALLRIHEKQAGGETKGKPSSSR